MKNADGTNYGAYGRIVSVPLRGNGYEKRRNCISESVDDRLVSVPLRGNGYEKLSFLQNVVPISRLIEVFPSPCGEMGMKNKEG